MTEVQQLAIMEKYISNTKLPNKERYDLHCRELRAFYFLMRKDIWEAVKIIFNYGMAKGLSHGPC